MSKHPFPPCPPRQDDNLFLILILLFCFQDNHHQDNNLFLIFILIFCLGDKKRPFFPFGGENVE